jgi:hypothetical protein
MKTQPPGGDRAVVEMGTSTADPPTAPHHAPRTFGYDCVDCIENNWWPVDGYDVVDWINEGCEHGITTLCTQCREVWLMGPEALKSGQCWRCRTNGGR